MASAEARLLKHDFPRSRTFSQEKCRQEGKLLSIFGWGSELSLSVAVAPLIKIQVASKAASELSMLLKDWSLEKQKDPIPFSEKKGGYGLLILSFYNV